MKSPSIKRMVDPVGLGTPKLFRDDRKRPGEPERDEPLEGLKKTRMVENCEDFNQIVQSKQTKASEPHPKAKWLGYGTYGLAMLFWILCTIESHMDVAGSIGLAGFLAMMTIFAIHWTAILSRVMSQGQCRIGLIALNCWYVSVVVWVIVMGASGQI